MGIEVLGSVSVKNPLYEGYAILRAKFEFMNNCGAIRWDFDHFRPDADYNERFKEFCKRIKVLKVDPTVEVVDGWYKVTSIRVSMEYVN